MGGAQRRTAIGHHIWIPHAGRRCRLLAVPGLLGVDVLNLLGAPVRIGVSHVGWRFDLGDEFQRRVADADNDYDGSGDYSVPFANAEDDAADEDVDCGGRRNQRCSSVNGPIEVVGSVG